MVRSVVLATMIVAQSVTGCLDSFRQAIPTEAGATVLSAYEGSWASVSAATAQQTCTNFSWKVTEVTTNGVSGTWAARCFGTVPVSGNATGSLTNGEIRWAATGTGVVDGVGSCPVALTGTAYLTDAQIRIPYTGTTCLGTVAGTEILRK